MSSIATPSRVFTTPRFIGHSFQLPTRVAIPSSPTQSTRDAPSLIVIASASFVAGRARRTFRKHRRRAVAVEAKEQAALLSAAWEEALKDREGSVWTEPQLFAEFVESLNGPSGSQGPVHFERVTAASGGDRDILLYVPGVDFAGAFAAQQFRGLAEADFELWRCYVGPDDRTPFSRMAQCLEAWVREQVANGRNVILFGESFGGLLSLGVALRLGKMLKGLVLVNPATSFSRTVWPLLGRALSAIPIAEKGELPAWTPHSDFADLFEDLNSRALRSPYPYIGSSALVAAVADGSQLSRIASRIATRVLDDSFNAETSVDPLLESFLLQPENMAKLLPPDTVNFRLRGWLRDGCEVVNSELRRRRGNSFGGNALPPTLLLASDSDRLLDSAEEAERLRPFLAARCGEQLLQVKELEASGHAPLDDRVDLAELVKSSPIYKTPAGRKDYVGDYEPPSLETLEQGSKNIEPIAAIVSPVFCSWDAASGSRRFGLAGVPDPAEIGRPVILVGNHQLLALDLGPLVREFLIEKGFSPRGLAHPLNFPDVIEDMLAAKRPEESPGLLDFVGGPSELRAAARASLQAVEQLRGGKPGPSVPFRVRARQAARSAEGNQAGVGENFGLGGGFAQWGAVPVTPRNFFRLMQRNEALLLFPGGAREACHGAGEKYKLFWSKETDFVRVAARFNAIVVPFGSVGSADNVQAGKREEASTTGNAMDVSGGGLMPVSESLREAPRFPNLTPRLTPAKQTAAGFGDRFYYSFGAPVDLKDLSSKDKVACAEMYAKIKSDVEGEMRWLLENRIRDPNRDFVRRQILERTLSLEPLPRKVKAGPFKGSAVRSYGRRAPSFPLE